MTPEPRRSRPWTIARLMVWIGFLAAATAAARLTSPYAAELMLSVVVFGIVFVLGAGFTGSIAALAAWLFFGGADLAERKGLSPLVGGLLGLVVLAAILALIVLSIAR